MITIDLKNRPDAPFDFPHRCFELSFRINAALDALTSGAHPWDIGVYWLSVNETGGWVDERSG